MILNRDGFEPNDKAAIAIAMLAYEILDKDESRVIAYCKNEAKSIHDDLPGCRAFARLLVGVAMKVPMNLQPMDLEYIYDEAARLVESGELKAALEELKNKTPSSEVE